MIKKELIFIVLFSTLILFESSGTFVYEWEAHSESLRWDITAVLEHMRHFEHMRH